jgi:hypothetical protein
VAIAVPTQMLSWAGLTVVEATAEIVGTAGKVDIDTARNSSLVATTPDGYRYSGTFGLLDIDGALNGFAQRSIDHFIHCVLEDREARIDILTFLVNISYAIMMTVRVVPHLALAHSSFLEIE